MKKFEVGKQYSMRSICDHECVWTYEVVDRTAKTITLKDRTENKTFKCRINKVATEIHNAETVKPLGTYSMAPSLIA